MESVKWGIYREKPGLRPILAAFICMCGIGFVSMGDGDFEFHLGDSLSLFCGFFYALQALLMERHANCGDSRCITAIELLTSSAVCFAAAICTEPIPAAISLQTLGSVAYMGLITTGLAFFLEAWGLKYVSALEGVLIMMLESVFAILFSLLLYHEILTRNMVIGFFLIFAAVALSQIDVEKIRRWG